MIDRKPETAWQDNLYNGWLGCLRKLSKPTIGKDYPEAMRAQAWAMKTLNTQHASWTQLRHDTILYAKQSYTARVLCYYPAGFVEPVPHFWSRLEKMAARASDLIEATPYPNPQIRERRAKFLRSFAKSVKTLHGISEKELAQKELNKEETKLLEDTVEIKHGGAGRKERASSSLFCTLPLNWRSPTSSARQAEPATPAAAPPAWSVTAMPGLDRMEECETWVRAIPKMTRIIRTSRMRSTTQAATWLEKETPSLRAIR